MSGVAAISAGELLFVLAAWTVVLIPAVVTALKGHLALFVAGFLLVGIVWLVAAFRLARPNSFWARRFYGPEKLAMSRERYPETEPSDADRAPLIMAVMFGLLATVVLVGFVSARLD